MPGTHEKTLGNTTCAHVMCGRKGTSAGKRDWGPGTGPCISTLRAMDIQQVLQLDAAAADAGTLRAALKAAQQALASTAPAASPAGCALRLRSDELAVQEQAGSAAAAAAAATVTSAPAAAAAALFTTDQLAAMLWRENELRLSPETQEAYRGALAAGPWEAGRSCHGYALPARIARCPVAFRRRPPARPRLCCHCCCCICSSPALLLLQPPSFRGGTARANVTDVLLLLSCSRH